ncbi:PREDICTED: receptor-like protein 12 isoform X1 [Nelumbo nucifera]|uniref:Receptor-like protein 12 isoform X1 n=1 Tax=Nelumbo nucifera TaxID=4432 RepID=A0A1U7ZQ92_NELNU|nr:PREDICTED: receptor-like protein 12 isoform X1 [Nelumbo nucifera]
MNSRSALGILWVWMILVVGFNHETLGCVEEERKGLLEFKAYVQPYLNNPTLLQSWVDDDSRSHECCAWERVECNSTTNRVIQLSLNNMIDVYFNLNVSLFLPFHELQNLSLSGNSIMSFVENQGLELLGRLKKLEVLDLSSNFFNNSIFPSLGALKSLKNLFLCENAFSNPFSFEGLEPWGRMEKLEVLDLCRNGLDNSILPYLGALKSLKILSLNENAFTNPFPEELAGLENLQMLDLSWNKLEGLKTLARLEKLEVLDFGNNALDNSILPSLGSLKSLKKLSLRQNSFTNPFPYEELSGLENLQILDLSWNGLSSTLGLQDQGFKHLDRLKNLEVLDFSHNSFGRSIIPNLGALKSQSLKSLDLSGNNIEGTFTGQEFANLYNLQMLYLSENGFNGTPQIIPGIKRLRKLEVLDISNNKFSTTILQYIGLLLPNIKTLYLGGNDLSGPITDQDLSTLSELELLDLSDTTLSYDFLQNIGEMVSLKFLRMGNIKGLNGTQLSFKGLCKLNKLEELNFNSNNGFMSHLDSCLGNLTRLRLLDLSYNQFEGNIDPCIINGLTSLEYFDLSNNHFQGPFSFNSLANLSNLEVFQLQNNQLQVEPDLPALIPIFRQLKILHLSSFTLNNPPSPLPNFLHYQSDLRVVDLSHNNFNGSQFPTQMLENNARLEVLNIMNNSFMGVPVLPSHPCPNLIILVISHNRFHGQIPENIGVIFPNLQILSMSTNAFRGKIPSSIGNMRWLEVLDLSNNSLSGQIPEHIVTGCSRLHFLKLSNNNLHGQMLPTVFNLTRLMYLHLDGNHFTGNVPFSLSKSLSLKVLDASDNNIAGRLPGWLGNLSDLQVLIMANNHFKGPIPAEFCALGKLTFVDLSMNNLNGLIPSCFPKSLEYVHLQKNELEGPIREAFSNSTGLVTLDISDNMLNGSLPRWIGNLSSLGVLLLKGNRLEGNIPIQLCHLDKINIMDLSHNNLSGPIPSCLKNLTFQRLDGTTHRFNMDELDDPFYVSGPGITMSYSFYSSYVYKSSLREFTFSQNSGFFKTIMEQVEFTTKSRYDIYKGIVLELIFGLDLSCNQLVGNIPPEIGELHGIHALNLSHNHLSGSIPTTISNLKQLESLDLSFNNLVGTIPPQITELHSLSVFTVAYNNLSGKTPEQKEQFATFGKSSYEGNPLLCGEPLEKSCPGETREPSSARPTSNDQERGFDMDTFIMSFVASYITVLLGMAAVFYINPYWRRQWFHLIHVCITSCYYFVVDNLHKFSVF